MKSIKKKIIDEYNWGIYVWKTSENKIVTDESGNILNIPSLKGNELQIEKLRKVAQSVGVEDGQAIFMSGRRRVTDDEYEYQKQRLDFGLVPDELDYFAAKEDLEDKKKNGLI
jgi:hypothetical protein